MRLLVLAAIIWPAMVTYGMSDPVLPPKNCDDFTFPDSVKNKTVAMVHQEYKNYTQQHNMTISSCNETTAFDLLSFAFNTIGNETETAKALGLDGRVQCMKYLKFTLKEIALQNLRDPTTFPGPKVTMFQLYEMQINDTTYKILQNVENVTSTLTKRGVMVNHTIHQLIQEGHFNDQSKFFLMLCFAINASDFDDTANQLLFKKELLNITMTEMADRLFTDVRTFQKDLSLKCAIRHLHSAMHWLKKLHDFLKQQRMAYMNQTVDALFEEKGLTKTNTTVFALLKAIFTTDHLTFLQFFGARSVDLNVLEFTASHLEMITFVNADVIFNYTLKELFGFTFMHTHIVLQYRMNVVLSKSRHELILKRYNVTMNDVMTKFNLTDDMIMALTEVQFENHVIRCFLVKYAESQNITLAELEARSNISSGALSNTTVFNFVDLLFKIGKANILRHIKEQRSLDGIIVDLSGLMFEDLRLQIIKEWQPLSLNTTGLSMLSISYLIFRKRVDPTRMYNMSFYYFLNSYMNPPFLSFNQLVKMYSFEEHSSRLEMEFRKYTFQEFCRFAGLKKYEIYTWSLKYFFTFISNKIINNVNECNTNPCAQIVGVKCSDHPFGFTCKCPADKNLDANKMCADIDECKEKTTPPCRNNSHCVNTMGSYECRCNKGFEDKNGACSDINECERDAFICFGGVNVNCTNTIGSFSCDCNRGFRFHPIYRICLDINECQEQQPCAGIQNSVCMNNRGSYECLCPRGYKPVMKGPTLISCEDIDECSNSTLNDCHEHATCTNTSGSYTCKCKEGYMGDGRQCKARKLFEVDPSKEKFIPKHGKIYLPFEIMYGEKKHNKLYISTNGFISIGKRYRKSSPKMLTDLNKDLWAVFWASTSLRFDSSVKYCELLDGDSSSAPLLDKVNKFIANSTKEEGFQATWAMIVTWRNMYPYWWLSFLFFFYRGETNTFQAVVATNGSTTVVTYLYEDGGMKWFTLGRRAAVGYANKHTRNGKQLDISFTPEIFDIDQKTYTDPAGNDRKGCLVYVFKPPTVVEPTPEEKCLNWIIKESRRDNEWIDSLPECPCYQNAIQEDPRFALLTSRDGAACYIMRTRKNRPKKSCCYDENGALLLSPDPNAGRAISRYADADVQAFTWCCLESTEGCQNFFQLRPSDKSCSEPEEQEQEEEEQQCTCRWQIGIRKRKRRRRRRRPVRRSWMFGDPHITTLDGFKYSFNGLGDFVMLQTKDRSTVVHARTQRPTVEGKLSNATIFSGFAFHSSMNSSVQVLFDKNMDGNISITTHSQPNNCSNFGFSAAEGKELDGFLFKKVNNTLIVLFDSGLAAEITAGMELLQISFSIPVNDVFNNKTEGLLGLLNEDMNDDLMYPNGTTISTNSSDKAMFYYGLEWKVPSDKAIFMNATTCVKQNVYFDSSFTPVFLSDLNTTQAEAFCGGNKECMLDFFATGSPQFARATRIYDENNERIKKIFDNRPPTITVTPKEVHATAGEEFTIMIKSDDPDKDTVSLSVSGLPQGASFNASTGKFIWTPPAGLMKMNIKFIARDDKNASSSYILPLRYCDCKNISSGNQCNFNLTQKTYANTSLHLVECNCTERFTGEQCETEVDPCGDSPCYENITCTATKNPFGYKCGPCPKGMDGDGKVCNDFDECRNASYNNCTAAEKCVNTIGSYRCDCKQGYKRNDASNKCEDVNECEQQFLVKKCKDNSNCVNTPGDYNCTCKPGYKGDPLKGCTDIDECLGDDQVCYGVNCNNTPGSFKCTCNPGYQIEKQADGKWICKDIDECEYPVNNNCDQVCKNIPGSFLCSCKQGFVLKDDKHSCSIASDSKCDSTKGGCMHTCTNSTGNVTCHCNKGYKLAKDGKACQDVNECSNGNGGCSNETGGCNNTAGSYNCYCNRGYSLQGNKRTCADVNECQNDNGGCKCARQGRCKAECVNDEGGSHCACKKGYKLMNADNKTCEDLNECESEPNICSVNRLCTNVDGGYYCSCKDRRMFSDGKKKCKRSKRYKFSMRLLKITGTTLQWFNDYENEYSEKSQQLKRQIVDFLGIFFRKIFGVRYMGCRVVGRFRRGSVLANVSVNFDAESNVTASEVNTAVQGQDKFDGLEVDPKASAVSDIDECSDPTLNGCHEHATCTNEPGTFSCSCKTGYQGDGFDCSAAPKKTDDGDDDNKKLMIILLCTLIPLAIIIIILIVWCCVRRLVSRSKKGNLYVDEGHQMSSSNIYNSRSNDRGEVYYGNENGRRGSEDSTTQGGTYDIATANYYDNVTVTSENGSKEAAL